MYSADVFICVSSTARPSHSFRSFLQVSVSGWSLFRAFANKYESESAFEDDVE